MSLLVFEDIHKSYGDTVALCGVSLEVRRGEVFGLLGPNGAGKSTLMKILCTLIIPTAGSVSVDGHDVITERDAVRAKLGYLPQEFGAWRLQRVEEALDTLAMLSGITSRSDRRQRVARALEEVGLNKAADRKIKKLSGGMLRRDDCRTPMANSIDAASERHPCSRYFRSSGPGFGQRVAETSPGEEEPTEAGAGETPPRAFGHQSKPQRPPVTLARRVFGAAARHEPGRGAEQSSTRGSNGSHREPPLLKVETG